MAIILITPETAQAVTAIEITRADVDASNRRITVEWAKGYMVKNNFIKLKAGGTFMIADTPAATVLGHSAPAVTDFTDYFIKQAPSGKLPWLQEISALVYKYMLDKGIVVGTPQ